MGNQNFPTPASASSTAVSQAATNADKPRSNEVVEKESKGTIEVKEGEHVYMFPSTNCTFRIKGERGKRSAPDGIFRIHESEENAEEIIRQLDERVRLRVLTKINASGQLIRRGYTAEPDSGKP